MKCLNIDGNGLECLFTKYDLHHIRCKLSKDDFIVGHNTQCCCEELRNKTLKEQIQNVIKMSA